jgi:tetratricopeptide (TPR) repeat protein
MYELRPAGHHLTSVLVHGLSTVLLFLVLRAATGAAGRSWLAAAFFGLHPLRVESVAWVAERKDVLSVCFGLLAVWAYVVYAKSKVQGPKSKVAERLGHASRITHHGSRFTFLSPVAALLRAEPDEQVDVGDAALRAAAARLLAASPRATQDSRLKTQGFRLLAFGEAPLLRPVGGVQRRDLPRAATSQRDVDRDARASARGQRRGLLRALRVENILAGELVLFLPAPGELADNRSGRGGGGCGGGDSGRVGVAAKLSVFAGRLAVVFGTLVPALGLVQVGGQAMADRYTYWPSIGLAVMVIWGLADLVAKTRWSQLAVAVAAVALAACVVLTRRQIGFWQDSEVLFRRAIAVGGEDGRTLTYLGSVLGAMGRPLEAIGYLRQAVVLKPEFPQGHYNLGVALCQAGMVEESLPAFRAALQAQPHYADALRAEAFALHQLGRDQEAVSAYEQSLKLDPESAEAHSSLGALLDRLDRLDEAMKHYREALRINPNSAQTHNNMGAALAKAGKPAEAAGEFAESLRLRPGVASAEINLANALSAAGQGTQAVEHFQAGV